MQSKSDCVMLLSSIRNIASSIATVTVTVVHCPLSVVQDIPVRQEEAPRCSIQRPSLSGTLVRVLVSSRMMAGRPAVPLVRRASALTTQTGELDGAARINMQAPRKCSPAAMIRQGIFHSKHDILQGLDHSGKALVKSASSVQFRPPI